jgi:hypothetical protein
MPVDIPNTETFPQRVDRIVEEQNITIPQAISVAKTEINLELKIKEKTDGRQKAQRHYDGGR